LLYLAQIVFLLVVGHLDPYLDTNPNLNNNN